MKKIFGLLLTAIVVSCGQKKEAADAKVIDTAVADSLTAEISKTEKEGFFNGFSVAVVDADSTLYQKGFGFADVNAKTPYSENTLQNIGSVSKTFIGIAILKAQELGKLKLDDPIDGYLPFVVRNPKFPEDKITIRQLATHTSSIADNEFYLKRNYILKENQDLTGLPVEFDDQVLNPADTYIRPEHYFRIALTPEGVWRKDSYTEHKPGTIYNYSNVASALAAFIVERATGIPFYEFTAEHITKPLGMTSSGWRFEDVDMSKHSRLYADPKTLLPYYRLITYPDGGFITSANDLGKFLRELIKGYNGEGTLLSKESYKTYFTQQLKAENFTERQTKNPYDESYNVGIFMGFGPTGFVGHTGGDPGVTSMMFFDPKKNIGRILILNTNFSDKAGSQAFFRIWDALEKYQEKLVN